MTCSIHKSIYQATIFKKSACVWKYSAWSNTVQILQYNNFLSLYSLIGNTDWTPITIKISATIGCNMASLYFTLFMLHDWVHNCKKNKFNLVKWAIVLDLHLVFFYRKFKFRTEGQWYIRVLPKNTLNFFRVFVRFFTQRNNKIIKTHDNGEVSFRGYR